MHRSVSRGLGSSQFFSKVLERQRRQDAFASSRVKMIGYGLDPASFYNLAVGLESPFAVPESVPQDLQFCIETMVREGTNLPAWRRTRWELLHSVLSAARSWDAELAAHRSEASKVVASHLSPSAHEVLRLSLLWPDKEVASTIVHGADIIGAHAATGIFRTAAVQGTASEEDLLRLSAHHAASMHTRRPPRRDQARAVWDKSEQARKRGILQGWFTADELDKRFGRNNWSFMVRFATYQWNSEDWRAIDDAAWGGQNSVHSSTERIHTTAPSATVAFWKAFRQLLSVPLSGPWAPIAGTEGLEKACRQLAVSDRHLKHSVVAVWGPTVGTWRYAVLLGLAFGLAEAVLCFNRYPALAVAIARRWLAIPAFHFFDGFKFLDVCCGDNTAELYLNKLLNEFLGWRTDPAKKQTGSQICKLLGAMESYAQSNDDLLHMFPTERNVQRVLAEVRAAIAAKGMDRREARSTHGRLQSMNDLVEGKAGRALLKPVGAYAAGNRDWDDEVEASFLFWEALLTMVPAPWKIIRLSAASRRTIHVLGDASETPQEGSLPLVRISFWLVDVHSGIYRGGVTTLPHAAMRQFRSRAKYIAQGELFAFVLPMVLWASSILKVHLLIWSDNLGCLSAAVAGSSRQIDLNRIIAGLHLHLARLQSTAWWEHVDSNANPADGSSREQGIRCPLAAKLGVALADVAFPALPPELCAQSPADWCRIFSDLVA